MMVATLSQSKHQDSPPRTRKLHLALFFKKFSAVKWGEFSLLSLYISVLSGIIVAMQYNPNAPFYSVSTIDLLVPFGAYFRSLHFYSSQLFFLFSVCHLLAIFNETEKFSTQQWIKLSLSLPVSLLILFTGYVLRADATGFSAGRIAESVILSIPLAGKNVNDLLFSITDNGMQRIYINHVIALGVLWGWMVFKHIKKYKASFEQNIPLTIVILLFSVFVMAPFEIEQLGITHIDGPWFFLGLQELLRHIEPLYAGIFFPAFFVIALCYLQKKNYSYRFCLGFILSWLLLYLFLTIIAISR